MASLLAAITDMTPMKIAKGWAIVQIATLVCAAGGAFPAMVSAHDSEQGDDQNTVQQDENASDNNDNGSDQEEQATATVVATKIVCDSEADLPNWGDGSGPSISMTTATDYVAAHPGCHLTSGWSFEWAPEGTDNPGDNGGVTGAPWTLFGPTGVDGTATVEIPNTASGGLTWFREVFQNGYVPFTFDKGADNPNANDVSAEMYCANDHTNYDNYDLIQKALPNHTYYCVAFNALLAPVDPTCSETQQLVDHVCVDNTPADPTCTTGQHLDNHVCVADETSGDTSTTTPADTTTPTTTTGGGNGHSHSSNSPKGQVLGVSCGLYMDKHIKYGSSKNDPAQVSKLQSFLNKWLNAQLEVTGAYDTPTFEAVKTFQEKYGEQILKPWEISAPTGLVYLSTLRQINLLECPALSLPYPELVPWNLNPDAQ